MNIETKRAFGPSLLHVALALAVTGISAWLAGYVLRDGVPGAFWGAAVATIWFLRGEIDQINPHWGWKSWKLEATAEDWQRMARQAGWPALAAHLLALAVLISRGFP